MDSMEQRLYDAYNAAVDQLNKIPKGDPRHIAANREVIRAHKALQRYRQRRKN